MSFENDTEVSIFTAGWLGVPRAEVGSSSTEVRFGENGCEFAVCCLPQMIPDDPLGQFSKPVRHLTHLPKGSVGTRTEVGLSPVLT